MLGFLEVPSFDSDGEEARAYIAARYIVSIVQEDGHLDVYTMDGETIPVTMTMEEFMGHLAVILKVSA